MTFLKLIELESGPVIVNMAKVEMVTPITGGRAKLWFSVDGEDAMEVEESFDAVSEMLHVALIGNRGVVSLADIAAVVR